MFIHIYNDALHLFVCAILQLKELPLIFFIVFVYQQ